MMGQRIATHASALSKNRQKLLEARGSKKRCCPTKTGLHERPHLHLALHGDQVCGLVWCLLSQTAPRVAHIYAMWMDPAARGQGAGRILLQQCIAWAKIEGAHHARLSVTAGASPAMQLYKSLGFYPVGKAEPLRQGSGATVQRMQLDLDADP